MARGTVLSVSSALMMYTAVRSLLSALLPVSLVSIMLVLLVMYTSPTSPFCLSISTIMKEVSLL